MSWPSAGGPPERPPPRLEARAGWLLRAFSPGLEKVELEPPPPELGSYRDLRIPRPGGGSLQATLFPAEGEARGGVLLAHPWLPWGRTYFHRRGRVEALRSAGYRVLTFDLGGVCGSGPTRGFFDRDVAAALAWLARLGEAEPLHLWGVSSGGYWSHMVLSRERGVGGAFFEDVAIHLLEWSRRRMPLGRPFYALFPRLFPSADRYLDLRAHAPHLRARAVAYVGGEADRGALAADTRLLAELAGGRCHLFPDLDHLESIKKANGEVIRLALETFARAEETAG